MIKLLNRVIVRYWLLLDLSNNGEYFAKSNTINGFYYWCYLLDAKFLPSIKDIAILGKCPR